MPRVVHFEITANNPEKVTAFYQKVFDWQMQKWDGPIEYWLVTTGPDSVPGINGGIFKPKENYSATINTIEVDNLEKYIERVKANNGQIVVEKTAIPGIGYYVYAKDIEGTLFGIMQSDPSAK